ncbi:glycosyltransferase family 4 protein [Subsaximicrobium wynnwilliamsii]|uniref:Glycosyltransferase family 4 protein n=1 Tax=Subsaximicrobium wynnwilliamsii TaxID=291179 RepID=A0A5C6ZKB8_9FLAO|nr:glycosyltransferase family 4 protein [Subsaximicrobium wynnwilliamsii]TXD81368.1 glycosyltransferase family 4 protein [Subsaximicrobium wynnwilliamsii]TXD89064.1 glycosyltransferase family 4 protein [Subsaximicrobium wynnwilliamsii]TXE00742.1 glycosyltransferase family 4 protein [Subsaximicrobium wynnwilliamsii]
MKNVLIIYPHWHPANLAGVHRPRLIGNFLPEFGWHPIILTVKEAFFEETPDIDFKKTFRDHFEVHRVNAAPLSKFRVIGDIGIRSFWQLYQGAKKIITEKEIDFIWIPVPSYYPALLGRLLYSKYKIPYGIDYIDPWVRDMKNYPSSGIRQRLALAIAKFLEPIAVKKASLISGVAKAYYQDVLNRNDRDGEKIDVAMPYGFDPKDHEIELDIETPWSGEREIIPYIYAGAFLPNSVSFFHKFFAAIKKFRDRDKWNSKIKLYFIGTGLYPGTTIQEIANGYGLKDVVVEKKERLPFLNILYFLSQAKGVLAIGSPSPHYTASKIFQSVLSKRPVFAFFHEKSTVVGILNEANADQFLMTYSENDSETDLDVRLETILENYFLKDVDWQVNLEALNKYSAKASAQVLVEGFNKVLKNNNA